MRRARVLAVAATVLWVVCSALPASAAARSRVDSIPDRGGVGARHDLSEVSWDYRPDWFVVTTRLAGRKHDRLWIWGNTITRTPIDCPDLRSRWRLGDRGLIRVSLPNTCLFGGYPMRDFEVSTLRPGAKEAVDRVASPLRLTSV